MQNQSISEWTHEDQLSWFHEKFRPYFDRSVIDTGQRLLHKHEPLAAFLWISCAIDWLAGFHVGKSRIGRGKVAEAYIGFIEEYFPGGRYDAHGLYEVLRNGFVHAFTVKGPYTLTHNNPRDHLEIKWGNTVLNAESLFADLVFAKNRFFDAVEEDAMKLNRVIERYERERFFQLVPLSDNE